MNKLEELKVARDAARAYAWAAWAAAGYASAAYDDELKKHKENGAMSKSEELKQTRDAEAAADAWAKGETE